MNGDWGGLTLFFDLLYDSRDEKRKHKEAQGEEDFKRKQLTPIPTGPDFFQSPYKKSKNESPHKDAQSSGKKIVPEPDFGQSHAKIHGSKWKINEP